MQSLIQGLVKNGLNPRFLNESDRIELQSFIDLFDDFFVLCEGEKGSVTEILSACPSTKDPLQDKFVLGLYDEQLTGVIDLIQNYPDKGTWTIGYLLIHPNYRAQGKGYSIVENLASALRDLQGKKLRCGVQEQNPRALHFWKKCGFNVVKIIKENLGSFKRNTYVLERKL